MVWFICWWQPKKIVAKVKVIQTINHISKGTSIGRNPKSMATMNKHKKRSYKLYRGQGK